MGFLEFNDVGIDLGTASILVYVRGKGIVLREPSVVAVEKITGRILAIGEEARRMLGRTPGTIAAVRPLRDGVISNYDITERLLHYFLKKVVGTRIFFKPRVVVCVPSGVTEVEKRSVIDATEEAGARHTYLIEEPIAAALSGMGVFQPMLTALVGLVPNCAVSVLLAQLYVQGVITFGSLFAGLTAGAGVGLAVLWRVNPSWKQNLFMTGLLWAVGAAAGMLLQILPL